MQISDAYDSMGNLITQSGSGGSAPTATRTYTYDLDEQLLTAATSAAGTPTAAGYPATSESFGYDDRGGPVRVRLGGDVDVQLQRQRPGHLGDRRGGHHRVYLRLGQGLATMSDPTTGTQLSYTYNNLSQVTKIGYGASGDTRAFGYNGLNELTSDTLSSPSGSTVASIGYGYDADGDLTSKTTTGFAGATANTYTYDEADRLSSWNNGTTTTNYAYDGDGNLTQAGPFTYAYDARDEETSINCCGGQPTTMSYTANGQLSNVSGPDGVYNPTSDAYGQEISLTTQDEYYDALGRVVTDQGFTGNHTLAYSGASSQIASDGTSTYSYDPAGNVIGIGVQGTASEGTQAYTDAHTDVVGAFTPGETALAASVAYDPWGDVIATSGSALPGALGYQSAYSGSGNGLVRMGSRWYWPGGHTFVTKDTQDNSAVPDAASANPFAYGDDDPLGQTDPTGHGSSSGSSSAGNVTKADVEAAYARARNPSRRPRQRKPPPRTPGPTPTRPSGPPPGGRLRQAAQQRGREPAGRVQRHPGQGERRLRAGGFRRPEGHL